MQSNMESTDMDTGRRRVKIPYIRGPGYPIGLCLSEVKRKGTQPECKGCHLLLKRNTTRFVLKLVTNPVQNWTSTESFHLQEDCISTFPEQYYAKASSYLREKHRKD
jgi:hypothetical protein